MEQLGKSYSATLTLNAGGTLELYLFTMYLVNLKKHFSNDMTNKVFNLFATTAQRSKPNNNQTEILKTSETRLSEHSK